jgi:ATP-dependent RNA helicase SUPV3L1/SUV3
MCSAIKRIIFYSLMKPHLTESGEKEMDVISTSQALQIAGRAGRYNTAYENGEVTTFRSDDLHLLKDIISRTIDPIEVYDERFYRNYVSLQTMSRSIQEI